jgi:hypothetical protein
MAKRRKKPRRPVEPEDELDEDVDEDEVEEEADDDVEDDDAEDDDDEPASKANKNEKSKDFFSSIGDGLKAAGKAAEKYTRIGLKHAELEKLRLQLKLAYGRLGEAVNKCWDAAPDIGVAPDDASVKVEVKAVNDLRRKIRETEIKIRTLNNNS